MIRGTVRSLAFALLAMHTGGVAADAHTQYLLHCGGCHGLEGRGAPPVVPTLRDEPGRIMQVPGGRDYLIRVPGVAQSGLSNSDLADVVNYVLTEFNATTTGNAAPFTEQEIARYRAELLENPQLRRAEIWRPY